MRDAFGIDRTEISKGLRLDKFASSRVGQKILTDAPLKPNEFWHGTQSGDGIRSSGFRLANPKEKALRGEQTRGRTGRPIVSRSNRAKSGEGAGVYLTKIKGKALSYAEGNGAKGYALDLNQSGKIHAGTPEVIRVKTPKKTKWLGQQTASLSGVKPVERKNPFDPKYKFSAVHTPQATKSGFGGVHRDYKAYEGDIRSKHDYTFANPNKLKAVSNRYRIKTEPAKAKISAVTGRKKVKDRAIYPDGREVKTTYYYQGKKLTKTRVKTRTPKKLKNNDGIRVWL